MAGAAATVAYDASRFLVASLPGVNVRPWEALPLFGQLLTGFDATTAVAIAAGFAYHTANGVGFGITYAVLFGRRGIAAGIGFALVLEAAMLAVYPGLLDIRTRAEFTSISMLGHVAYGATLGWIVQRSRGHPVGAGG